MWTLKSKNLTKSLKSCEKSSFRWIKSKYEKVDWWKRLLMRKMKIFDYGAKQMDRRTENQFWIYLDLTKIVWFIFVVKMCLFSIRRNWIFSLIRSVGCWCRSKVFCWNYSCGWLCCSFSALENWFHACWCNNLNEICRSWMRTWMKLWMQSWQSSPPATMSSLSASVTFSVTFPTSTWFLLLVSAAPH